MNTIHRWKSFPNWPHSVYITWHLSQTISLSLHNICITLGQRMTTISHQYCKHTSCHHRDSTTILIRAAGCSNPAFLHWNASQYPPSQYPPQFDQSELDLMSADVVMSLIVVYLWYLSFLFLCRHAKLSASFKCKSWQDSVSPITDITDISTNLKCSNHTISNHTGSNHTKWVNTFPHQKCVLPKIAKDKLILLMK